MLDSTMVLISDDPPLIASARQIVRSIEGLKLKVISCLDAATGRASLTPGPLVVIHQIGRGQAARVEPLLRQVASARRPVATLVLGDPYDPDEANELFRLGVVDYLGCPIEGGRLARLIEILTAHERRGGAGAAGPPDPAEGSGRPRAGPGPILDEDSAATAQLLALVRRLAPQDATILLQGEAGTGKTRLARLIHDLSPRRYEPFVVVDCGATDRGPIEDELFGQPRGSFAGPDRPGKLAGVGRGTLLLDDVAALPSTVQARLLRAIEERAHEPAGPAPSVPMAARLIAASRRPLEAEVADGRFRSDLFYRLNVVNLPMPALRDRRETIGPLASRFAEEAGGLLGVGAVAVAPDAVRALEAYAWPGNVRELREVVEQVVGRAAGREIRRDDLRGLLPADVPWPVPEVVEVEVAGATATGDRDQVARSKGVAELARINEALRKHGNNRLRAAGELGISRMTLYKKLYKYGLMNNDGGGRGVART